MSVRLPEPPRRAEPAVIYGEYAAEVWSTFAAGLELPELRLTLLWRVGRNGDSEPWMVTVDGAELSAAPTDEGEPTLEIISDRESWKVGVFDIWKRFVRFAQPNVEAARARLPKLLSQHPPQPRLDALRELPGTLDIEYVDDAGDVARFSVRVAGGDGPRGLLRIGDADLWTMLRSRGKISQLLRSRATLDGDVGWILRLARLAEAEG